MGFDNPNSTEFLSALFSGLVIAYFYYCFFRGATDETIKPLRIPDRYDIGYVDDQPATTVVVEQKPTKVVQPKPAKSTPVVDEELLDECIEALQAVGVKKADAKKAATKFLSKRDDVTTAEQFIMEFFKK